MKKLILITFVTVFCTPLLVSPQMNQFQKYSLTEEEVPISVIDSQNFNFPSGYVTNWFRYSNLPEADPNSSYYISSFQKQGVRSFKAYYNQDGKLISKVTFMPTFALPEQIQEGVHNSYLNSRIKSGDLIELYDRNIQIYRIRINMDGLIQNVYFDRYARMLDGQKIPIEVISFN